MTTVSAEAMLRDQGRKGGKRRAVVDQAAAVLILQHALDTERATGAAPGEIVEETAMTDQHDQSTPDGRHEPTSGVLGATRASSRRPAARKKRRSVPGCLAVLVALAVIVGGFYFVVDLGHRHDRGPVRSPPRTTTGPAAARSPSRSCSGDTRRRDRPQPQGAGRRRLGRGVHRPPRTATRTGQPPARLLRAARRRWRPTTSSRSWSTRPTW